MVVMQSKIDELFDKLGIDKDTDIDELKAHLEEKKAAYEAELRKKVEELEAIRNGL